MEILLSLSIIIVFAVFILNYRRNKLIPVEKLKPNCLLTRSPIIFISGKRSFFYFGSYWNQVPNYLMEHGYEVFELNLPWRNEKKRLQELESFLKLSINSDDLQYHIILDEVCHEEFSELIAQYSPLLQSLNIVKANNPNHKISTIDLQPLQVPTYDITISTRPKFTLQALVWRSLLLIHNFIISPARSVKGELIGVPGIANTEQMNNQFLNAAVKLAEREI